jgi:cell division septum initiation protein DivIVA
MSSSNSSTDPKNETKNIKIQGGAEIFGGEIRQKKSTRSSRVKRSSQILVPKKSDEGPAFSSVPTPSSVVGVVGGDSKQVKKSQPAQPVQPQPAQPQPAQPQPTHLQSQTQPLKVILKKNQDQSKKVFLKPKKHNQEIKNHTRKSRKVTLGIHGLKKRLTKAQNIRKSLASRPIEELKKELVMKGILKAGSKTPDDLVRQIAGDAEIVKGNLL